MGLQAMEVEVKLPIITERYPGDSDRVRMELKEDDETGWIEVKVQTRNGTDDDWATWHDQGADIPVGAFMEMASNIMAASPLIRETIMGDIGLKTGTAPEVTTWQFKPLAGVTPANATVKRWSCDECTTTWESSYSDVCPGCGAEASGCEELPKGDE